MSYASGKKALNAYGESSARAEANYASPHRLVQIMLETFLSKVSIAKGLIDRKDYAAKGEQISTAVSILTALKASLDLKTGGEIANNLDDLYGYVNRRLMDANLQNDVTALDESAELILQIKGAWDSMPDNVKHASAPRQAAAL